VKMPQHFERPDLAAFIGWMQKMGVRPKNPHRA
jgi:hypothetical protein